MHTLHWIAVEELDEENAVDVVERNLESYMSGNDAPSTWYDWYVVGGGRWNIDKDEDFTAGYTKKSNMVISFAKDPNAFRAKIDDCIQQRLVDYNQYYKEVVENNAIDELANYGGASGYTPSLYALYAVVRYQMGEWSHDSWFFDMVHDSTNATHILSKLDRDEGQNLFLVPVDFHF